MDFQTFLTRVIDNGIVAAKRDYAGHRPVRSALLKGSIEGFEACRGKRPEQLAELLKSANAEAQKRYQENSSHPAPYWEARGFAAEVEWVCNVVSCMLHNEGAPVIVAPTGRGLIAAVQILGVRYFCHP